jgi:hypothetical protein
MASSNSSHAAKSSACAYTTFLAGIFSWCAESKDTERGGPAVPCFLSGVYGFKSQEPKPVIQTILPAFPSTKVKVPQRMYSSYSLTTSALHGGEWSASRPGRALPPVKGPPVRIVQEAGWASAPVWTKARGKIILPLAGIEPRSPGRQARYYIA